MTEKNAWEEFNSGVPKLSGTGFQSIASLV